MALSGLLSAQVARFQRMRQMDATEIGSKLKQKAQHALSYRKNVRRLAYALDRYSLSLWEDHYRERPEDGAVNLAIKLDRQRRGGPFEPYDVALVNRAAARLAADARTIFEAGSGTGMFASLVAERDAGVQITASEFDDAARGWAEQHRAHPGITYCRTALEDVATDEYDLSVALEVIEHIDDYPGFLHELARIAPHAIVSTPNKARSAFDSVANTPVYYQHVREWTSGEFFWVLRTFWHKVQIYTIPDLPRHMQRLEAQSEHEPPIEACGLHSRDHAMIAVCSQPRR